MVHDTFGIVGTTLAGTYRIEEVIAEGGFGVVYRAEHVAFRAPVALKCLKIPGTISPSHSVQFIENFREEAEILFHLSAQIPEVVRPLHADAMTLEDGTFVPYIAMEWIEGRPLDSIVILRDDQGLPPLGMRTILKMLTPIAHALAKAHHFTVPGGAVVVVTHCDLKPENILITEPECVVRAKVLDFGISKARDKMRQDVGRITESEQARPFTPSYGAPEQWVPKRFGQSGPWTDVWGLALTMVECLTGKPPIEGDMHAMMGTALDPRRRPTPRTEGAQVNDAVESAFERALAVDPRDRFQDIDSFWTELELAEGVAPSFEAARGKQRRYLEIDDPAGAELELELETTSKPPPATSSRRSPVGEELALDPVNSDPAARPVPPARGRSGSIDLDLEHVATPMPPASHPRAAMTSSGNWRRVEGAPPRLHGTPAGPAAMAEPDEPRGIAAQLRAPLLIAAAGILLTVLDIVLASSLGGTLQLGPLKIRWIAAAFVVAGVVLGFWNLLGDKDA